VAAGHVPEGVRACQHGQPKGEGDTEEPNAKLHLIRSQELCGEHGAAAPPEDESEGAEELSAELGGQ
jgi:uncharacterized protein YcnI